MNSKPLTAAEIENLYQEGRISDVEYADLKSKYFRRMARQGK